MRTFTRSSTVTAIVGAQALVQLPVADVERDHVRGAVLQQAVGEAAGRGADVEAVEARDGDGERFERVLELLAAAGDVARRPLDRELGALVDLLPAFACPGTRPASTSACACARDSARPRSTSRTSSRFFTPQA